MKTNRKEISLLILIILMHFGLLLKLKFTAWPEMLLWPYLWLHGILPYKSIAIAHTPLLIAKLTVFYKLFGVGILQLQVFTWLLVIATDLILYFVVKKIWNAKIALLSLIIYVPLQIFFDGNGLWFDLLLAPIAILLYYFVRQKRFLAAGLVFALGFLTKQTVFWFLAPIVFVTVKGKWSIVKESSVKFVSGFAIIFLFFLLLLFAFHLLPSFFNWAINFGIFVLPKAQGQIQLPDMKNLLIALFPFTVLVPFILNKKNRDVNLISWTLVGFLGAYPRFEYFHFQPALPFLAVTGALVFADVNKGKLTKIFLALYILGSLYLFGNYFLRNWGEGIRFDEQDVTDVVNYVKSNTNPNEKIFVMNWWDNIYPLTNTIPATDPWVPQLSWYLELPGVQDKEVEDIKNSKPKLILLQGYLESGLASYKPQKVYDYVMANYKLKEKVDGIEVLVLN